MKGLSSDGFERAVPFLPLKYHSYLGGISGSYEVLSFVTVVTNW